MRKKWLLAVWLVLGLVLAGQVSGTQSYVVLSDLATIRGGDPEIARILLRFDLSGIIEKNSLDYAEIQFPPFLAAARANPMTVQGFRLTTDWDQETVTWDSPWETSGGDYDTTVCVAFRCGPGDTLRLHLDITELLHPLFQGSPNYGLILKRPLWEGDGFHIEGRLLYQALLREGRVSIYHTRQE